MSRRFELYSNQGPRVQEWLGENVVKYHRTLEEYWRAITEAGFKIESIKEGLLEEEESEPEEEMDPIWANYSEKADSFENYRTFRFVPPFLIFKAFRI